MPPVTRHQQKERYPYPAYNFIVSVTTIDDGKSVSGAFSEVTGLQVEVPVIEYRDGADLDRTVRKMPGVVKVGNITLKRGVSGHIGFWQWVASGVKGDVNRQSGYIALLNEDRDEVMRWNFEHAWPTKYSISGLNAKTNEILFETVELVTESLLLNVG